MKNEPIFNCKSDFVVNPKISKEIVKEVEFNLKNSALQLNKYNDSDASLDKKYSEKADKNQSIKLTEFKVFLKQEVAKKRKFLENNHDSEIEISQFSKTLKEEFKKNNSLGLEIPPKYNLLQNSNLFGNKSSIFSPITPFKKNFVRELPFDYWSWSTYNSGITYQTGCNFSNNYNSVNMASSDSNNGSMYQNIFLDFSSHCDIWTQYFITETSIGFWFNMPISGILAINPHFVINDCLHDIRLSDNYGWSSSQGDSYSEMFFRINGRAESLIKTILSGNFSYYDTTDWTQRIEPFGHGNTFKMSNDLINPSYFFEKGEYVFIEFGIISNLKTSLNDVAIKNQILLNFKFISVDINII
jgi:hypothetical protein